MPYIGRAATNAGSVNYLDDISSGFDGSDTTFTCAISGTTITPGQENVFIYLDGVFQDPGSSKAYTISGSTITFTEAPANGTIFTGYVAGEGAYLDDGTVSTAKLDDDAVTASKLDDDGTGFQVGDLGVGGSLTSGDKLTVTGRLRASGGIIGDLTGNVTGNTSGTAATVTGAAQSAITSLGTLTTLTVDDITLNGSTISDAADLTFDIGGDVILDADGEHIWLKDGGTTIGNIDFGSSNITIRNSVSNADLIFRGNDGGTEVEAMRINYSGNNVGIGTSSIGAKLHVDDDRSTAYNGAAEIAETVIFRNKNGTDNSGVNNVVSLSLQVADGATSQGFINYVRTGNNTGDFTFSQRTGSSSYAEHMRISNTGYIIANGASDYPRASRGNVFKSSANGNAAITLLSPSNHSAGVGQDIVALNFAANNYWADNKDAVYSQIRCENGNGSYADRGQLVFANAYNGATIYDRMVLDFDGNLGIGTMTPEENVHIKSSANAPTTLKIEATATGERADLNLFGKKTDNGGFAEILFVNDGDSVGAISCEREGANDAGAIVFTTQATGAGMTEKMRLDSGGSLSIGGGQVAYSTLGVHTIGTNSYSETSGHHQNSAITIDFPNADQSYGAIRWRSHGNMEQFFGVVQQGSSGQGDWVWQGFDGSAYAERMRLSEEGLLAVKWGIDSYGLYLNGLPSSVTKGILLACGPSSGTVDAALFRDGSGHNCGAIYLDATNNTANFSTSSDYRLKENEEIIPDGIERIKKLKPYKFNFKSNDDKTKVDGFFAHELAEHIPEAVNGEKDEMDGDEIKPQSVDYGKVTPLLVKAVQELIAKVEALENA